MSLTGDKLGPEDQTLVMDGNFKAEHLHPVNPSDEVSLMDGLAFMVGDERYKSHLSIAQDRVQRSDCNNHHAVNQANASRQKLEATGIGGCACAQHGCFVPHSMVDFQKGERQMNMDYALSQALNYNTDGISQAITFYDINCLWHVHGHQDSCYVQYASNFIRGTGRIDGEIMETLWASLNIISPSARGMGTPHRKEVLDYQMNDCNFIKMIRMTKFLCRKFKEAARGAAESKMSFQNLNETAHPDMVILWEAEEALAHANRLEDPTAMDIYEVRLEKESNRSCACYRLKIVRIIWSPILSVDEGLPLGSQPGLTIEEFQISLSRDVKRLRRHPTDIQLLRVARLRDKLQTQITNFLEMASTYLGCEVDANEPDSPVDRDHDSLDEEDYSDLDDHDQHLDPETHTSIFQSELTIIPFPLEVAHFTPILTPLPSNLGEARCKALGLTDLMKEETVLREGQANDALHAIRVHLGDKTVIFRDTVRSAKSQAASTQAWTQVRSVEAAVKLNVRIYSKCRLQLGRLPNHNLLKKYLPLEKEHLKTSTAVADPNACGQRNTTLAWFWSLDVQGDTSGNDRITRPSNVPPDNLKYIMTWPDMRQIRLANSFRTFRVIYRLTYIIILCWSHHYHNNHRYNCCIIFFLLSMNHTGDLVGSAQVMMAYSDGQVTAGEISHALFYANLRLLAMRLYVDKSFATSLPGYAEAFHTLMKWEMETFVTPFINITFLSRCSAVIPTLLHDVIAIRMAHTLVDRQPDVTEIFMEIKALDLLCTAINQMNMILPGCQTTLMHGGRTILPLARSSVQDVMELVEGHFAELPDHVETGLLPYMLKLGLCQQTTIGQELMNILQGRMMKLEHSSDRLACLAGLVEEIRRAVLSSQALMDRLNTDDSASEGQ
ncbi:uncharacterized protein F5147DRAFT_657123 [Suillus discolor]|uniref:Uncharacterized protein n=1 Tax=Suillus discolor TaxID=1912936 RepID=A0A9P7EXK2_9AGAM|nr:uncharacterized protein F5147DRAFT_657123 [Suillus discolor]KAG2094649.1 hypothetical protein F5147DRAFT_657123 [Suillus discolor]